MGINDQNYSTTKLDLELFQNLFEKFEPGVVIDSFEVSHNILFIYIYTYTHLATCICLKVDTYIAFRYRLYRAIYNFNSVPMYEKKLRLLVV